MKEAPIFITGLHKSGTTLLRSLLDGHPSLQCIPFESHLFPLYGRWTENDFQRSFPRPFARERFSRFIAETNATSDPYGDNFAQGKIDLARFEAEFQPQKTNLATVAESYFSALRHSIFGEKRGRMVEKSIENFEYYHELKGLYPQAKFVHLVRNPYQNLVSLRKFKQKGTGQYPLLSRLLPAVYQQYQQLWRNRDQADYYVLRYEDLVADLAGEMRKLCDFLALEWSDSLLQPTLLGEAWAGNSTSDQQFSGVQRQVSQDWQKEISAYEAELFNRALGFVPTELGYERFAVSGSRWKRMPGESLPRFFYNRLYNWYWRFYEGF